MESPFIYVVDDEPGIAMLCERLLRRAGYRVETETDSRKAVNFFKQSSIDLLVVDIRMPNVDGFEVIQQIKRIQPDAAILIMTGHGTVEIAIRALRQGVDGLLMKPFGQGNDLLEAVKQALLDSQQKHDAARINTLRPLFSVTESLLSEKHQEPLLDLIVNAISEHLHCSTAACYRHNIDSSQFELIASKGIQLPGSFNSMRGFDGGTNPIIVYSSESSSPYQELFRPSDSLGTVILVPILRPNLGTILLVGARSNNEPAFRGSDLELFQILSRQAAVALENARLYEEQLDYVRKVEESQKALLQAEKMAAAGRLSASIAHEVNNPLQAVQNCLHLATQEGFPEEKKREYFDMAKAELDRLMVTVQRMLEFYRPGAVSLEKVNLEDILQYVLNLMGKQLAEAKIMVKVDLLGKIPPIMAVGGQIQQVFINLILNATDAMPDGGTLKITVRPIQRGVEILFQDDGKGIPVEKQQNIFDPFYSTKEGGTGLGLTVSYNIITAHAGTLEFVPGRVPGACFRIFLPAGE